ncbi:RdRP-domain-containing protein [Polyporus arcularius HHB13444]|uniref:RNA-dependent RNA polymerase n=1 Tax=Polyporus arcularius HHB13444 TaxID=1314778 RepID=A0A5C3P8Q5_9APHY|nr:RdRP-domain-containing protein [Polyporus arcularius HHB13444]
MNIQIRDLPFSATEWDVKRAFATILHQPPFYDPDGHRARRINFEVQLGQARNCLPNNGTAKLIIPDPELGSRFVKAAIRRGGERIRILGRAVYLSWGHPDDKPPQGLIHRLNKTPFVDPDVAAERIRKLDIFRGLRILVDAVQFGVYFRHPEDPHTAPRRFSVEHEMRQEGTYVGEVTYDYNHKLLRVELGNHISENTSDHIVVDIHNIKKSAYGKGADGQYYICLELWATPRFERQLRYRHFTGEHKKDRQFRERLPHLGGLHEHTVPYAFQLRLVLTQYEGRKDFRRLCEEAGIARPTKADIPVEYDVGFFTPEELEGCRAWIQTFEWPVRFPLEALLHNGLVNTADLHMISKLVEDLVQQHPSLAGDFLRRFSEKLKSRSPGVSVPQCFQEALAAEQKDIDQLKEEGLDTWHRSRGFVQSAHAIVTPTRILLEGPYDTQSNRVIRRYFEYRDNFIRVEFREENRMPLHWPADVNGRSLIEKRFGDILRKGFEVAGRHFRFLGYSTSGLREHSAWFMSEFQHPVEGLVTVDGIRKDLGTFESCIRIPSKYAARIAQAFSGTHPSVCITRDQWDDNLKDLGDKPYEHTDGQGIISPGLRDLIWEVLTQAWPDKRKLVLKPSAFQFRFLGFKGVVVVDERLKGIHMSLRPSMKKFLGNERDEGDAEIEIAKAYTHPGTARLCRPLVAVLEDLGIHKSAFVKLQDDQKRETITASDTMAGMVKLLRDHDLGNVFGLRYTLQYLEKAGMGTRKESGKAHTMDNAFIHRLVKAGQTHIMREFKHEARIPIKDAQQLVGVVDEGTAWLEAGVKDVFRLKEGQIFACVQNPEEDTPHWIQGHVSISRSPHIHPGDVQRVWAIGKPPDDVPCFFRNLRNVVVMPSVGKRSLASMLAGGDVDGDEFLIIKEPTLLPTEFYDPANYEDVKAVELDRDSNIDDICDFFVEYMQSDVMGLVADQHLLIADQSRDGVFDRDCMKLAQLCSQAVDYAKNGVPVRIDDMPTPYIRAKPDWKKKEDNDVRPGDYYESPRALGLLFRNIDVGTLEAPPSSYPNGAPLEPIWEEPLSDNISKTLKPKVRRYLERVDNDDAHLVGLELLFRMYARELAYVCLTHAPAENADVRLSEEEVTVGAILAHCSKKSWKKDRMHRMREHVGNIIVDKVKHRHGGLGAPKSKGKSEESSREELLPVLAKAWAAWDFGMRNRNTFGANSFSLIGLNVVCETLERLEKLDGTFKAAVKPAKSASK